MQGGLGKQHARGACTAWAWRCTHPPTPRAPAPPLPPAACERWTGELRGLEGQALAWVGVEDLERYEMPPADVPLLPPIRAAMRGQLP